MTQPLEIVTGDWVTHCLVDAMPSIYDDYRQHAMLCEEFDLENVDGTACFFAAGRMDAEWPQLVVAQRFQPGIQSGFGPGALLAQDTAVLFLGAGTRLLGYDLRNLRRLWEDVADVGFWSWRLYDPIVVMAAELEMAAWTTGGQKLWSAFVEPPWTYTVDRDKATLDVMGDKSQFQLSDGPANRKRAV